MRETITYALHLDGYYVSRLGTGVAWPVLDYVAIGRGGYSISCITGEKWGPEYAYKDMSGPMRYRLERLYLIEVPREDWLSLKWTRKVPIKVKNWHRNFWGLKPLRQPKEKPE